MAHILLVEDTMTQALYMQHTLEKAGHRITLARSGAKALEALAAETPDYVLSDINMPGMSGFELVTQIKAQQSHKNLPCLLLLTASSADEAQQIMASQADGIIFKSGSAEKFVGQVNIALAAVKETPRLEQFFAQAYRQVLESQLRD